MANAIVDRSFDFAVRIVRLYSFLTEERHEYVMSKQLLRCGTSIGANVAEAQEAQSTPDFLSKLYIALKECSESRYWLKLLNKTGYLSDQEYISVENDASQLYALLTTIIKSTKTKRKLKMEN